MAMRCHDTCSALTMQLFLACSGRAEGCLQDDACLLASNPFGLAGPDSVVFDDESLFERQAAAKAQHSTSHPSRWAISLPASRTVIIFPTCRRKRMQAETLSSQALLSQLSSASVLHYFRTAFDPSRAQCHAEQQAYARSSCKPVQITAKVTHHGTPSSTCQRKSACQPHCCDRACRDPVPSFPIAEGHADAASRLQGTLQADTRSVRGRPGSTGD